MFNQIKKYFLKTYGCAMNYSDSEKVSGWYEQKGWEPAKRIEDADEVVIVTCSVRQTAEDRVYGLINNIKNQRSNISPPMAGSRLEAGKNTNQISKTKPKIILTGCMLRYSTRWLKEKMPQVDEFKKVAEYKTNSQFFNPLINNSQTHAFVKIMEGCNNFCSYCVVPYARGREVSRPFKEIICEVEELAKRGTKEITLLGQNVNSYGKKSKIKDQISKTKLKIKKFKTPFADLLSTLQNIEGIEKISFLTSNPWDLNDEIIEAMSLPEIDRYLHLPVQSGDNEILKKMNRHYTVEDYLKLVEKIRKKILDIQIGTDIIVGFPGETEEQFQNSVLLCRKVKFVKAYVSMYSPRMQTVAYKLTDDISHKEKRRRWKILDELINNGKI